VSSVLTSEGHRSVLDLQCECGNSMERGGIYPCDEHGIRIESSDLLYCDRCDKITARETGQVVRYRSFFVSACGGF
jgi:hypothetical protein